MIRYSRKNEVYKIIHITGNQNNILGVTFDHKNNTDNSIEVIEWYFSKINDRKIRTSKEEVLKQVLSGLECINESLSTEYRLLKIYFSPFDIPYNSVYSGLICMLIRHYHNGYEFKET